MDERKKGRLIVVSGPSGAGKSTLIERFLAEDKDSGFSISYTTRKKRDHEADGKDYYFVSKETFEKMVGEDGFLEWESVHGYLYGTSRAEVLRILSTGRDVILDIDVKGALSIRTQCTKACLIFVEPPSTEELVRRLSLRGEKEIDLRMKRVQEEIARKALFEYTVRNDDLESAYRTFQENITAIRRKNNGKNNR